MLNTLNEVTSGKQQLNLNTSITFEQAIHFY